MARWWSLRAGGLSDSRFSFPFTPRPRFRWKHLGSPLRSRSQCTRGEPTADLHPLDRRMTGQARPACDCRFAHFLTAYLDFRPPLTNLRDTSLHVPVPGSNCPRKPRTLKPVPKELQRLNRSTLRNRTAAEPGQHGRAGALSTPRRSARKRPWCARLNALPANAVRSQVPSNGRGISTAPDRRRMRHADRKPQAGRASLKRLPEAFEARSEPHSRRRPIKRTEAGVVGSPTEFEPKSRPPGIPDAIPRRQPPPANTRGLRAGVSGGSAQAAVAASLSTGLLAASRSSIRNMKSYKAGCPRDRFGPHHSSSNALLDHREPVPFEPGTAYKGAAEAKRHGRLRCTQQSISTTLLEGNSRHSIGLCDQKPPETVHHSPRERAAPPTASGT